MCHVVANACGCWYCWAVSRHRDGFVLTGAASMERCVVVARGVVWPRAVVGSAECTDALGTRTYEWQDISTYEAGGGGK